MQTRTLIAAAVLIIVALTAAVLAYRSAQPPVPSTTTTATTTVSTSTAPASGTPSATQQGVRGVVLLGPMCPTEQNPPVPNCNDRPYATLVAVFSAADPVHAVALLRSDDQGQFAAALPPGRYTLGAGESTLPRCNHPSVTIVAGAWATTTIECDTGIR